MYIHTSSGTPVGTGACRSSSPCGCRIPALCKCVCFFCVGVGRRWYGRMWVPRMGAAAGRTIHETCQGFQRNQTTQPPHPHPHPHQPTISPGTHRAPAPPQRRSRRPGRPRTPIPSARRTAGGVAFVGGCCCGWVGKEGGGHGLCKPNVHTPAHSIKHKPSNRQIIRTSARAGVIRPSPTSVPWM